MRNPCNRARMKKFSIITVCLNSENYISKTIASVLNQTCTDFEYIIKDGVSKDRTVSIAQSYSSAFAERGIPFRIISQPDKGIYDAMNQALREVQGEWVLYMNAGDLMADNHVLQLIEKSGCLERADIVYGDEIDCEDGWYFYYKARPLERIRAHMPFCHQSAFVNKSLYDNNTYSLQYRLCSDYLFFLQRYLEGKRFSYFPIAISIFDKRGVTSDRLAVAREMLRIHEDMPVRDENAIQKRKAILKRCKRKMFIYNHFSKYLPKKLREKRWDNKRIAGGWKDKDAFFSEQKKTT